MVGFRGTQAKKRGGEGKPLSTQPGHSWKYLYERLNEKRFQQLCGALLRHEDAAVRLYPVGMSDGGRDATAGGASGALGGTIYQVKWTKNRIQSPVAWLKAAVEGEAENIERLVANGATRYVLMTCVAGTSAPDRGTMDKLDREFEALSKRFGVPMEPLWQADLDGMVDAAPDAIKWTYADMLAGHDAIRFFLHGSAAEGRAAEMRTTLLRVMRNQGEEDAKVKFSQADLDQTRLADMYVDVEAELVSAPKGAADLAAVSEYMVRTGALSYLLATSMPYTVVRGEPGQGKSTLGQYLCQVHRALILSEDESSVIDARGYEAQEPRLTFRVDLRHYASWLEGTDPFDDDPGATQGKRRGGIGRSLEHFLVDYCHYYSGGRSVSVEQVQDLLDRYPTLIVLDGLDEVGEQRLRTEVVKEIDRLASQLGGAHRRWTQLVVTTRPNSSSQAEPTSDLFEYVRLRPMNVEMQKAYLGKWAAVNGLSPTERRKLKRVFVGRTAEEHIAQLSANPMHLTILLYLINKRGEAVPSARTAIYSAYMDALMDREIERDQIDKDDVDRIHETTSWLGWRMHAGVETDPSLGKLPLKGIRTALFAYLQEVEGPEHLLDKLFTASADRFWALTSKEGETYEFAVQPVREYFAARYLAKYAGMLGEPVLKGDLLAHLVQRPYWLNTTLFYVGFADPNELAGLVLGLEGALESGRHPLQVRVALWALLRDGVFSTVSRTQKRATGLLTDDLSLRLVSPRRHPEQFPDLPDGLGASEFALTLNERVRASYLAAGPGARSAARLLAEAAPGDKRLGDWVNESLGAPDVVEEALLDTGAAHSGVRLTSTRVDSLALMTPRSRRAALALGVVPKFGSPQDVALLAAVLSGEASDVITTSASHGGSLLRAVRPHRFIDLAKTPEQNRFILPTAHLEDSKADEKARQAVFSRLKGWDVRYEKMQRSTLFRKGQKGSTAPWQDTAREIAVIHGPCWLATEIALIGVATRSVRTGGSFDPGRSVLGSAMDYGVYVQALRQGQNDNWWRDQAATCTDNHSKMAWVGGLLVSGDDATIRDLIATLESFMAVLTEDEYLAVLNGLSRISASGLGRRVSAEPLAHIGNVRLMAALLLFTVGTSTQDRIEELELDVLERLAVFGAASWPAHRALTARLLDDQTDECLRAVGTCGPYAVVELPDEKPNGFPDRHVAAILQEPLSYAYAWVAAAERWRSRENTEEPLEQVGVSDGWLPDL